MPRGFSGSGSLSRADPRSNGGNDIAALNAGLDRRTIGLRLVTHQPYFSAPHTIAMRGVTTSISRPIQPRV
jgi:hypothetical protein